MYLHFHNPYSTLMCGFGCRESRNIFQHMFDINVYCLLQFLKLFFARSRFAHKVNFMWEIRFSSITSKVDNVGKRKNTCSGDPCWVVPRALLYKGQDPHKNRVVSTRICTVVSRCFRFLLVLVTPPSSPFGFSSFYVLTGCQEEKSGERGIMRFW